MERIFPHLYRITYEPAPGVTVNRYHYSYLLVRKPGNAGHIDKLLSHASSAAVTIASCTQLYEHAVGNRAVAAEEAPEIA